MYQQQWAEKNIQLTDSGNLVRITRLSERFEIKKIRIAQWEEHCLECAAPQCYRSCEKYAARQDGRCRLLLHGFQPQSNPEATLPAGARVIFKPWGCMLTFVYPAVITLESYKKLERRNNAVSRFIKFLATCRPIADYRLKLLDGLDFLRRYWLKHYQTKSNIRTDYFLIHCFNHQDSPFRLILEIVDRANNRTVVFRDSALIEAGENFHLLDLPAHIDEIAMSNGHYLRIYPENNYPAEITFYICDFVTGVPLPSKTSASASLVKCLVWDLDNTLWDGILIESDANELSLRPGVHELIMELDRRGIVQSIASKNDADQAIAVLQRLRLAEYFVYPMINWGPKSASLQAIAQRLNIGIDALAFIDDSMFEREEVRNNCPAVRIYDEQCVGTLLALPEFDTPATEESRKRRQMYQTEAKRTEMLQVFAGDQLDFLRRCGLQIEIFPPNSEEEMIRCHELLQRTNQLNISGLRYSMEEFQTLVLDKGFTSLAFSCRDMFGEYGIVCFARYQLQGQAIVFNELAISCRVAQKYVESAFFQAVRAEVTAQTGEGQIAIEIVLRKTEKNSLMRRTLEEIGYKATEEVGSGRIIYRLPADEAPLNCDIVTSHWHVMPRIE